MQPRISARETRKAFAREQQSQGTWLFNLENIMKKKIILSGLLWIGLVTGAPLARADVQCQFFAPFPGGNSMVLLDGAAYQRIWPHSTFAPNAFRWFEPFTFVNYLAYTDGDVPTPCVLGAITYAEPAYPYYLQTVRPFPPDLRPFHLAIDAEADPIAYLPEYCWHTGFCISFGVSYVGAAGAGLPNVFVTTYIFSTIIYW